MMKTTNDDHIGAVALKFLTPQMRYKITKCTQNNGFVKITKQPPEEVNKTWTFRKTNISIIMECNGVVIKHFQFDDKQCVATWGRDVVKKVLFSGNLDSASLTYRAKPGKGNQSDPDLSACWGKGFARKSGFGVPGKSWSNTAW